MPNWCSNHITVRGTNQAEIQRLAKALSEGKFCHAVIPTPPELTDTMAGSYGDGDKQAALEAREQANLEKFGYKNWYDFKTANWGTKWDVEANVQENDGEIGLTFDSAWSPPQRAIALLAEKFNDLSFHHAYLEEGMCFVGYDDYEGGVLIDEFYCDDTNSDECKEVAADEFGYEAETPTAENYAAAIRARSE